MRPVPSTHILAPLARIPASSARGDAEPRIDLDGARLHTQGLGRDRGTGVSVDNEDTHRAARELDGEHEARRTGPDHQHIDAGRQAHRGSVPSRARSGVRTVAPARLHGAIEGPTRPRSSRVSIHIDPEMWSDAPVAHPGASPRSASPAPGHMRPMMSEACP